MRDSSPSALQTPDRGPGVEGVLWRPRAATRPAQGSSVAGPARPHTCLLSWEGDGRSRCQKRQGEGTSRVREGGLGRGQHRERRTKSGTSVFRAGGDGALRPQESVCYSESTYSQMQAREQPEAVCWVAVLPSAEALSLNSSRPRGGGGLPAAAQGPRLGLAARASALFTLPQPVPRSPVLHAPGHWPSSASSRSRHTCLPGLLGALRWP